MSNEHLERSLNRIVSANLWEPGGDPGPENLSAAADAYVLMRREGVTVQGEQDVIDVLSGDNICETNFLSEEGVPDHPQIAANRPQQTTPDGNVPTIHRRAGRTGEEEKLAAVQNLLASFDPSDEKS